MTLIVKRVQRYIYIYIFFTFYFYGGRAHSSKVERALDYRVILAPIFRMASTFFIFLRGKSAFVEGRACSRLQGNLGTDLRRAFTVFYFLFFYGGRAHSSKVERAHDSWCTPQRGTFLPTARRFSEKETRGGYGMEMPSFT